MVVQYPDVMTWNDVTIEENDYGYPVETITATHNLYGRYENFMKGWGKEHEKIDGVSILADGVYYAKIGQDLPKRFDLIEIPTRGYKGQILHVYKGQLNNTIYIKELK